MKNVCLILLTLCLGFGFKVGADEKSEQTTRTARIVKPPRELQKVLKKEKKILVIGGEVRNYTYSEPGFVSHAGYLFGIWGDWSWNSALGLGKTSANLLFGALTYEGQACNLSGTSCNPLTATTNDMIVKFGVRLEHVFNPAFRIFYGGGFRYLYDKGEGSSFYTRTGEWVFLPVGLNFETVTSLGNIFLEFEYDYTIYGVMKSALSEVSSTLNDITSNQKGGYGLVISGGVNLTEHLMTALIYESWNANDSDIMASGGQNFREPANSSQAFGLRVGYTF